MIRTELHGRLLGSAIERALGMANTGATVSEGYLTPGAVELLSNEKERAAS